MQCTRTNTRIWRLGAIALTALLASCGTRPPAVTPSGAIGADPQGRPAGATPGPGPALASPGPARNWDDFKRQAALRMVAANPERTYMGVPPDPLLAIPVLEIEIDVEGRVRSIAVLRVPTQAKDTMKLAIDAVRRAAPFGNVAHLPLPWKFSEVFLFDDERRFKPRTLDE